MRHSVSLLHLAIRQNSSTLIRQRRALSSVRHFLNTPLTPRASQISPPKQYPFSLNGVRYIATQDEEQWRSRPDPGHWRTDAQFQQHRKRRYYLRGSQRRLPKLLFFNPAKDPSSFVIHWMMVFVTIYYLFNLTPGETLPERRKRMLREKLYDEVGLTEADLDEIEGMDVAPLSESGAEEYGRVMDPLLEPKEGRFTAAALRHFLEQGQEEVQKTDSLRFHPAITALHSLQQSEKPLPAEIRNDPPDLTQQLLARAHAKNQAVKLYPDEDTEDVVLPRSTRRRVTTHEAFTAPP